MRSVIILTAVIAACADDPTGPPDEASDVEGVVIDPVHWLLLAPSAGFDAFPNRFVVSGADVVILQADGSYRRGTTADASKGDVVRAWLPGIVLEIYRGLYEASRIEIRPSTSGS